jgi:hypothetical protein
MSNADLARFIDRYMMEFVRIYPHPIERVWKAITDPAELAQWFIAPSPWELRTGGRYRFDNDDFSGVVLAYEPPRRSKAARGYSICNTPRPASPAATGRHRRPGTRRGVAETSVAGVPPSRNWADLLDGVPCGSRRPQTEFGAIAQDWAERFGAEFSAEQKTKILRELRERERWFELRRIYRAHVDATLPSATGA